MKRSLQTDPCNSLTPSWHRSAHERALRKIPQVEPYMITAERLTSTHQRPDRLFKNHRMATVNSASQSVLERPNTVEAPSRGARFTVKVPGSVAPSSTKLSDIAASTHRSHRIPRAYERRPLSSTSSLMSLALCSTSSALACQLQLSSAVPGTFMRASSSRPSMS